MKIQSYPKSTNIDAFEHKKNVTVLLTGAMPLYFKLGNKTINTLFEYFFLTTENKYEKVQSVFVVCSEKKSVFIS